VTERNDPSILKQAAERKSRRSGLKALVFLVVALAAAVGSALLLTRYMDARLAAARVPTEKVVVASLDLPVGAEIRTENLRLVDWPAASRPQGAFRDVKEAEGKVVSVRMVKDEPVLSSKLSGGGAGTGLAALLPQSMRAVAVRVDDVVGVAGFVQPGDTVDVIVTMRPEGPNAVTTSKIILQNIRVLAVGKDLDHGPRGADRTMLATVATLMVNSEQSERLALAATQGKILLSLRSAADADTVATQGVTSGALVSVAQPEPSPRPGARVARRAPPPAPPRTNEVVEILRGDLYEKRDFQKETRR
jgi:pilus assembly protein CpaB